MGVQGKDQCFILG